MAKELKVRLYNKDTGEFETIKQSFIPLGKVIEYMKLEEEIGDSFIDGMIAPKPSEVFEKRLHAIAELFDDKRVSYESLIECANAMDKLVVNVSNIVMNQYADDEEINETAAKKD